MATISILPPRLVDSRFFKSISFWAILFSVTALVAQHYSTFALPEIFGGAAVRSATLSGAGRILYYLFIAACLLLWGRLRFKEGNASQGLLVLPAVIGLGALVIDSLLFRPQIPPAWVQSILIPINFISTGLILGGFLSGMIFGHYYLVNTDMPKKLLVTMAWILIGVLAFRILAVGTTLLLYKEVIRPDTDFLAALISFQGHGIFFWQRVLVGLAIPAIVVAMIWSTARIGSNQSATGIMYVAIAFVFIGELAARYLFLLSAIPL